MVRMNPRFLALVTGQTGGERTQEEKARFLRRDDEAGFGLMVLSTSELPKCCCS